MKILIMGLSGAGKTYLAERLQKHLDCDWHNADKLREKYNDWDFSREGRIRQAYRMEEYAEKSETKYVICDFICALEEMRNIFSSHYVIWMDTVKSSQYEDTDKAFEPPKVYDLRIDKYLNDNEIKEVASRIRRYRSSMMLDSMNRPHTMDIE